MLNRIINILFVAMTSLVLVSGCGRTADEPSVYSPFPTEVDGVLIQPKETPIQTAYTDNDEGIESPEDNYPIQSENPPASILTFSFADIPEFTGYPYITINNNQPYFLPGELTTESFERYAPLDTLGRCGAAVASIGVDLMPTEERGPIGMVKPSGWHTVKYDCVDGRYLYNRCHLIGFQLSGENANTSNLITGTRFLNIEGMLPFENMVNDFVKETGNHVMYRVTPIFEGSNLVASGILMEGYSVEDQGEGIEYCVYAYNAQPGVIIDYATGDSVLQDGTAFAPAGPSAEPQASEVDYILNINSGKFHYPTCSSVDAMNEKNKKAFTGTRDELIQRGYSPCARCCP